MTRTLDPTIVSPSRVQALQECGLKFEMRYVDGLKPPRMGSRMLFGNVMHRAREEWCSDRKADMVPMVKRAWAAEAEKDAPLKAFLYEYEKLSLQARSAIQEIHRKRPELKAPRQSKDWQNHPLKRQIDDLCESVLLGLPGSVWAFGTSDPLPSLYDESIALAAKYAAKWRWLPNALHGELGFTVEWQGFTITGKIDEIMGLIDPDGVPFYGLVDAKTHREHPFAPKYIDQGVAYRVALPALIERGLIDLDPTVEIRYGIDAMRILEYRWFGINEQQERRYLRELRRYKAAVEGGAFMANAARCDADLCGYRGLCIAYHSVPELTEMDTWFNEAAA